MSSFEGNILKTLYKQNVEGLGEREIGRDLDMKQETLESFIQGSMNQRSHDLVSSCHWQTDQAHVLDPPK